MGGAEGGGPASGEASVTRMLTSLFLAWGDGVRARAGVVARRAEFLRELRRREPAVMMCGSQMFISNTEFICRS